VASQDERSKASRAHPETVTAQGEGLGLREWALVAALAAVSLAARALLAARVGIFQDEALYWWLAHDPEFSFCPHPPATPLVVLVGGWVFGHGTVGLRAGSLFSGTLTVVLAALLGRELYGRKAAVWAAGLLAVCPLAVAVGCVATPDATLASLWMLIAWTTWHASRSRGLWWWIASGAVVAAGAYTKYMMALAVPCALVALLAWRPGRTFLRGPGPWVALGTAVVLFVPVFLIWDWRHGWTTLRYHLMARHELKASWSLAAKYFGGHAAFLSPVIWVGALAALVAAWREWRRMGSQRAAWLLGFGLLPILFFLVPSLLTKRRTMRVHWDLIGYCVGIVGLAGLVVGGGRRRWLGLAAIGGALPITVALFIASLWPAAAVAVGARPPSARMLGWERLAARVKDLEQTMPTPHLVLTSSFHSALCLGFVRGSREGIFTFLEVNDLGYGLSEQLKVRGLDVSRLVSEYPGRPVLYVHEFRHPAAPRPRDHPRRVLRLYRRLEPLAEVKVEIGGRIWRRFGLYRASDMVIAPQ